MNGILSFLSDGWGTVVFFVFLFFCFFLFCPQKWFSIRLYLQLFLGRPIDVWLFAHSGVQHILCRVFWVLFFLSSSCVPYIVSFSGLFIFDCPFRILLRLFTHHIHFPHTVGGCILIGNPELTCVHKVRICEDMCLISIRTESI